jgi:tRNA A-37 threonylcarbamoyl transferase component Bud32
MSGSQVAHLVGRRLGERYRLESLLGHGGMAVVYRAVDEALGRSVAVKVFSASSADADDLRRQDGEVRMLASLSHPGLVTLFDAGVDESEHGPVAYIVMELVEGDTLQGRMSTGSLSQEEVATIGADLADALHYIHRQDVVHRDIKPANVLLATRQAEDTQSTIKLADFGIARIIDGTQLTATGTIIGTMSYLSPEQAMGSTVDASADIYALGLVLLECLTGSKAFPGSAAESVSARVLRDPDVPESLPEEWRTLLSAMTSRVPTERPPALDASLALRALAVGGTYRGDPVVDVGSEVPTQAMAAIGQPTEVIDATAPLDAQQTVRPFPAAAETADATGRLSTPGDATTPTVAFAPRAVMTPPVAFTPMSAIPPSAPTVAIPPESGPVHASKRAAPPRRWAWPVVIALIALVLAALIGWSVLRGLGTPAGTGPVDYPDVPGELGTSLEQLQRSVEDPE